MFKQLFCWDWQSELADVRFLRMFSSIFILARMNNAQSHAKKEPPFVFSTCRLLDAFLYEQTSDSRKVQRLQCTDKKEKTFFLIYEEI
jgi:hypothetical protein